MNGSAADISGDITHLEFRKLSCDDSGCDGAQTKNQCWNPSFVDWPDDQNSLLKFRHITTLKPKRMDLSQTL